MRKLSYMRCGPIKTIKPNGEEIIDYVGTKETRKIIKNGYLVKYNRKKEDK